MYVCMYVFMHFRNHDPLKKCEWKIHISNTLFFYDNNFIRTKALVLVEN